MDEKTTDAVHRMEVPGYEELADILREAYKQAAVGKGAERHAGKGEAFTDQVMQDGAKRFGVGALLFQAYKKSEESQRLDLDPAVRELLGGIVYLAGAVIARRKAEKPTVAENKWLPNPGHRPIAASPRTKVSYELRSGTVGVNYAGDLDWSSSVVPMGHEIVKWRFV